jgi:hypothetical protein
MEKRKAQIPLVCHGHSRPIVDLSYSPITPDGFFLVSASKGMRSSSLGVGFLLLAKLDSCNSFWQLFRVQMGSQCSGMVRQVTGLEPLTVTKELYGQHALTLPHCVVPLHLLISARKSFSPFCMGPFDASCCYYASEIA